MNRLTETQVIKKFKAMPWQPWLHRRFSPFVSHMIMWGGTRAAFKTQAINGEFPIALYDTDDWYSTPEMFCLAAVEAEKYLKQKSIFDINKECEEHLAKGRQIISALSGDVTGNPAEQFRLVVEAIKPINVYVWVAHAAEALYGPLIHAAVKEYFPGGSVEKIVGDISYPSKKNFAALLEDDIRAGVSAVILLKKYASIKARGGFIPGYSLKEIKDLQKSVLSKPAHTHQPQAVPPAMAKLVLEVQEMVYLRTLRTDALWELIYLAQPVFFRYAKAVGIESVKDYTSEDLLAGKFRKWPHDYAAIKYYDEVIMTDSIIKIKKQIAIDTVKGVVAKSGMARGVVKVIRTPNEIGKVEVGDILVTNMTTPAYLAAMRKAAAFVTDEGGITCHAAILAREMNKPCVIGTKIATQIFKDGDMVEVDADNGVVKKI